jgi:cell division control protein 24
MDPLSVAASVVGLLSAAGQVYTLLEQISSAQQCPVTIQDARTEVKQAELALRSMQRYLQRLDLLNPQRAALIQVDELRVTLADAMLSFADFESLLQLLSGLTRIHVMITWSRYSKRIEEHLAKVQRYKSSLILMLGILQW